MRNSYETLAGTAKKLPNWQRKLLTLCSLSAHDVGALPEERLSAVAQLLHPRWHGLFASSKFLKLLLVKLVRVSKS